ncbi:MAG: carbohydrate ABC transporter permease [Chloroflexota bacterium]
MNERQNSERSLPGTAVALPRVSHSGSLGRLARYSTPYWYIAPFFIIFFAFFAYPVIYSFYVSLHTWSGQGAMTWVGWDNYNFVLSDNYFMEALQVSGLMWLSVPFTTVLSLVIAVIWNHPRFWGRNVVLILFLLPTVISIVAVSLVFRILYDPTSGPIDAILSWLHLPTFDWLNDENPARAAIFIVRIWETVGLGVLFFASSLQAISQDLYDAAAVDGCGPIRGFFSLTVPLLARTILFLMVISTLSSLSLFAEPNLIESGGGPNNATVTIGVYLWLKVQALDLGTASAVSFLLTTIMMVISVALFLIARRWISD